MSAAPTTEPRAGPAHTIIVSFDKPITGATATVAAWTATASLPALDVNDVIVSLTDVTDQQYVTEANYLKDANVSGTLSLADKGMTNTQVTKALPAP